MSYEINVYDKHEWKIFNDRVRMYVSNARYLDR